MLLVPAPVAVALYAIGIATFPAAIGAAIWAPVFAPWLCTPARK